MIIHHHTVLSDDIFEKKFVCDLHACKGACCVEGDAGAPLQFEELAVLDEIYPQIKPYLTDQAIDIIEKIGLYEIDEEGDFCTQTIENKECVFATYDDNKILKCGIEQAYNEKKN